MQEAKDRLWRVAVPALSLLPVLLIAGLLSCSQPPPAEVLADANLLLITLDTLRADALGLYGYPEPVSPHLDRLGSTAVVFERAYATAPFTGPSHASILTSQHPSTHGIILNGHRHAAQVSAHSRTLAEHLQAAGFHTGAVVSGGPLDARYGFNRGFDTFRLVSEQSHGDVGGGGPQTTGAALDWLRTHHGERFFLWVHYLNPHLPYVCAEEVYEELGLPATRVAHPWRTRPEVETLRQAYRAEVYETDSYVGQLLATLEELGLTSSTVVAVVADHGEYLWDHELYGHTRLFDQVLHVPMLIRSPGASTIERRPDTVSTIDLVPTLLPLLAVPPLPTAQGRDLLLAAAPGNPKPVFAEWRSFRLLEPQGTPEPSNYLLSAQLDHLKLIRSPIVPSFARLFDLSQDPLEENDLAGTRPDLLRRLDRILATHLRSDLPNGLLHPGEVEIDDESREMLRTLGYVE